MKWNLKEDLTEHEGETILSHIEGFSFYIVSATKEKGLEIIALDEFNERYTLFDVETTGSSIAQALREEAGEIATKWIHPLQGELSATKEKWTDWIHCNIVPFSSQPFKRSSATMFRVEEQGKCYALMTEIPFHKLGVASEERVLILNVKIDPNTKEKLLTNEGFFEVYHMNKKHWISIALNVCTDEALIKECIYYSYKCVSKKDNSLLSKRGSL